MVKKVKERRATHVSLASSQLTIQTYHRQAHVDCVDRLLLHDDAGEDGVKVELCQVRSEG